MLKLKTTGASLLSLVKLHRSPTDHQRSRVCLSPGLPLFLEIIWGAPGTSTINLTLGCKKGKSQTAIFLSCQSSNPLSWMPYLPFFPNAMLTQVHTQLLLFSLKKKDFLLITIQSRGKISRRQLSTSAHVSIYSILRTLFGEGWAPFEKVLNNLNPQWSWKIISTIPLRRSSTPSPWIINVFSKAPKPCMHKSVLQVGFLWSIWNLQGSKHSSAKHRGIHLPVTRLNKQTSDHNWWHI